MSNLASQALAMAAKVRRQFGYSGHGPLCVYDLIEQHFNEQIDLRFQALPSLEGMYNRSNDAAKSMIIVSTERPGGRRRFTCAHELGHHLFGHSLSLDELQAEERRTHDDPKERLCDLFAGLLLMPKLGLLSAARLRGFRTGHASAAQLHGLASYFGVGYSALLTHAAYTLQLIDINEVKSLAKTTPQQFRTHVLGAPTSGELLAVDTCWEPFRPVDLVVGDHLVVPTNTQIRHPGVEFVRAIATGDIYQAVLPGVGRAENGNWDVFIRSERQRYTGMARFRNLEECDE